MQIEKECVLRQDTPECDRDCRTCDLCQDTQEIISAYDYVIRELGKAKKSKSFIPPTVEEVTDYCIERNNGINPEAFIDFYESKGWVVGKSPMKDWKSAVRTWERNGYSNPKPVQQKNEPYNPFDDENL